MPFSWQASRTVRVKVLGGSPWILNAAMIASSSAQESPELLEAALPAEVVAGEARRVDERTLCQDQLGLAADRAELDAHRGLVAAQARPVFDGMIRPGE